MTKPNCCAIAVVLDRSGSMSSIRRSTIEGFNEFLLAQKAVPAQATFSLVQFDNEYEVVHDFQPLQAIAPLTTDTFVPRGSTALLDAIGRTINDLGTRLAGMPESDRPSRVLFTIITDGFENASHEFTRDRIFQMITHQREKYGWEFMFLAANQDAIATGVGYGIDPGQAASWNATDVSSRKAFRMAAEKQAFSRRSGTASAPYSDLERADLLSDDPADSAPKSPDIRHRRGKRGSGATPPAQSPSQSA